LLPSYFFFFYKSLFNDQLIIRAFVV